MLRRDPDLRRRAALRAGFTLTELLVAVVILLVVILAVGGVFSTVSRVTASGQATASFLQASSPIERQIRRDLERMVRDGFLGIRCVTVMNDVNRPTPGATGIPLLDPTLPAGAALRCDQLVFFAAGLDNSRAFTGTDSLASSGGNQVSSLHRVYIGHAFQAPGAREAMSQAMLIPLDPIGYADGTPLVPWAWMTPSTQPMGLANWPAGTNAGVIRGAQPRATSWILARQRTLLADDAGDPLFYNFNPAFDPLFQPGNPPSVQQARNSTATIWLPGVGGDWTVDASDLSLRNSRVDIAAIQPTAIRNRILFTSTGGDRSWTGVVGSGQDVVASAIFYPRAEPVAPSMRTADQMLVAPALANGVTSFAVDWTWDDGVGRQFDRNGRLLVIGPALGGSPLSGMVVSSAAEQPWFGIEDPARGVRPVSTSASGAAMPWGGHYPPICTSAVERYPVSVGSYPLTKVRGYEALFGPNETTVFNPATGALDPCGRGFTPWPSALRFTITIADPQEDGPGRRVLQFIVRLPKR